MSMWGTALLALVMQTALLQGIVVRKGTTEGLSKATVELRSMGLMDLTGRDQGSAAIVDSITTEDDGRFSFGNVAPGRYRLTVTRRGYTRPPLAVTVAAGQPAEDIQVNMTPAASISGRAVDADGRPLGNVEVKAMKASYPGGTRTLTPVQSVLTNDLGEYRLFWLAPGRYYVAAVHPKAQGSLRRVFSGNLRMSGGVDPALNDADPRPDLDSESGRYAPIFSGGTTDEQTASGIDLPEGAEFGGVNFVVAPVRPRHVRGVVIDGVTGKSAEYGSITLPRTLDGPRMKDPEVDRETGRFDMLLYPGSYAVNASSASGEGYATFTLGDADIENLTIPTTPGFNLRGRIVVDGEPISAAAIESLRITLRRDPPLAESLTSVYDAPLPDGSFTIYTSAGDFRINIAPVLNLTPSGFTQPLWTAFQNTYVKSIRLGDADILNGILKLDREPSTTLEVVIATNPGALDGQVMRPVADLPVILLPDIRRRSELYRTTTTDGSGRFHFDRVPPGDYKVFSWEEVEDGAWFDPDFMRANESRGIPVRIREGRTENVRIEQPR